MNDIQNTICQIKFYKDTHKIRQEIPQVMGDRNDDILDVKTMP